MLSSLPKNLINKFSPTSKIPFKINEIIENTLSYPLLIPRYLNSDSDNIKQISPYNNNKHVCEYHYVNDQGLNYYYKNYKKNKLFWEETPFSQKKDVFLKAADLIENKYYNEMLAYTIVGQNKNVYEAEIDSICELVDFLRFNTFYAEKIISKQPIQTINTNNISEYNSQNGFIASITPFNFTAIGGNLASVPLLFGNSVLWKPSDNSILSNHLFYEIMLEAGLPDGVLNFCPMHPDKFLNNIIQQPDLSSILFTGSSTVLDNIYGKVGANINNFNNYPRIVGESGGKNFHFIGPIIDNTDEILQKITTKTVESCFNYSGQKCSAGSILYIPYKYLEDFIDNLNSELEIYGKVMDNYGVINKKSFDRICDIIVKLEDDCEINFVKKGKISDEERYYIEPHVLICKNHNHMVFNKEFFAPILAIYPYNEEEIDNTIDICLKSNNYSLTGSIFSNDNKFIDKARFKFRHKTGNFYINDKSTGSVVGQQPFGGSGKSGTNDKAGDINLLYRLLNQRNIKINQDYIF